MKKNAGFTLIELVIVIIVLGILAATAVPKFINLQDDAKESAIKGVEASLHSAANIVYSKAAIDGIETKSGKKITVAGEDVNVEFGYPAATSTGIERAVEISGFEAITTTDPVGLMFVADGNKAKDDLCVVYQAATSAAAYTVTSGQIQTTVTECKVNP